MLASDTDEDQDNDWNAFLDSIAQADCDLPASLSRTSSRASAQPSIATRQDNSLHSTYTCTATACTSSSAEASSSNQILRRRQIQKNFRTRAKASGLCHSMIFKIRFERVSEQTYVCSGTQRFIEVYAGTDSVATAAIRNRTCFTAEQESTADKASPPGKSRSRLAAFWSVICHSGDDMDVQQFSIMSEPCALGLHATVWLQT